MGLFLPSLPNAGGLIFVAIYVDFIMTVNRESTVREIVATPRKAGYWGIILLELAVLLGVTILGAVVYLVIIYM